MVSRLKHEESKVDHFRAEKLVAVARADVEANVVGLGFVLCELERVNSRTDGRVAERSFQNAEFHVHASLIAAQLGLENKLKAEEAIQ